MNVLDENILETQREFLLEWGIPTHHIGHGIGWQGMKDDTIIPLLHQLRRPTFFTRDLYFYKPRLRHAHYCLVYLTIEPQLVAVFVHRFLRHPAFNAQAKRMGCVVRVSALDISVWRLHANKEVHLDWLQ